MIKRQVYLDHAAATPVRPEVREAMEPYFSAEFGNPSSLHSLGVRARGAVEDARAQIAALIGARPAEITFTGSATEANNIAILGYEGEGILIISPIEHPSILEATKLVKKWRVPVKTLKVGRTGRLDLGAAQRQIETGLVSVIYASNELGTIQDLSAIAKLAHKTDGFLHTDACQAASTLELDVKKLGVDLMTLSAAKIGGPKGVGALYHQPQVELSAQIFGGGQEQGLRPGTENVAAIVGFAKAFELARAEAGELQARLETLKAHLQTGLKRAFPAVVFNGDPDHSLAGLVSATFPGLDGEALLLYLDREGIQASAGSACEGERAGESEILSAVGLSGDAIRSTLRYSLGPETSQDDLDYLLGVLPGAIAKLR